MATRRMITSDIWRDRWFGRLGFMEQSLWIGLFSTCADDQGRLLDNAVLIRSDVFPYQDVPIEAIEKAIEGFTLAGKVTQYEVGGECFIQLVNWWEHQKPQWASRSRFEPPEGWIDRVRTREAGKYIEINWPKSKSDDAIDGVQVNSSPEGSPEQSTQELHTGRQSPCSMFHVPVLEEAAAAAPLAESEPAPVPERACAYMTRIIEPTQANVTHLIVMVGKYGLPNVEWALNDAFEHNGRTWAYVETILKRLARASPEQSPPVTVDTRHLAYIDDTVR